MSGAGVVGPAVPTKHRQRLENAALGLQLARARRLQHRDSRAEVVAGDYEDIVETVHELCSGAREVIAVTQRCVPLDEFIASHRVNQALVESGVRMISLFETRTMSQPMLEFLAAAEGMPYYCCYGPVQLKVFDRTRVLLDGPIQSEEMTLLHSADPELVAAALAFVRSVQRTAVLASDYLARQSDAVKDAEPDPLTARQRRIADLLDAGATDEDVAELLGISVRTVRYEVARLMAALDAKTRFAAGRRYGRRTG